jgi:hypothetical protein
VEHPVSKSYDFGRDEPAASRQKLGRKISAKGSSVSSLYWRLVVVVDHKEKEKGISWRLP